MKVAKFAQDHLMKRGHYDLLTSQKRVQCLLEGAASVLQNNLISINVEINIRLKKGKDFLRENSHISFLYINGILSFLNCTKNADQIQDRILENTQGTITITSID